MTFSNWWRNYTVATQNHPILNAIPLVSIGLAARSTGNGSSLQNSNGTNTNDVNFAPNFATAAQNVGTAFSSDFSGVAKFAVIAGLGTLLLSKKLKL